MTDEESLDRAHSGKHKYDLMLLQHLHEEFFKEHLATELLEEVAVNRPGEIWLKVAGRWQQKQSDITLEDCWGFSRATAVHNKDYIGSTAPILSATLPTQERIQIIAPPATETNTVSITIRKPSLMRRTHQEYIDNAFYAQSHLTDEVLINPVDEELKQLLKSGAFPTFMEKVVEYGKTIFVVGETGSGKTTYMKMLMQYIPEWCRIITIEDTPELRIYQPNFVNLFYPADAGPGAIVTSDRLIRSMYRMNPDRPLLAEVRGREAFDALKLISSGHEGFISSLHAGSAVDCITGLIDRCYEHPSCANMSYDILLRKVMACVDVIVSIDSRGDVRRMKDVYFKPLHHEAVYGSLREK